MKKKSQWLLLWSITVALASAIVCLPVQAMPPNAEAYQTMLIEKSTNMSGPNPEFKLLSVASQEGQSAITYSAVTYQYGTNTYDNVALWGACAVVVLVIGAVVVYNICKIRVPPPPTNNPPPPPPPPRTNRPPRRTAPGANSGWVPMTLGSGPTVTNSIPDSQIWSMSISVGDGLWDTNNPQSPTPYFQVIAGPLTGLESSTNLIDWYRCSLMGWVSSNGFMYVVYDGFGSPMITNYSGYNRSSPPWMLFGSETNLTEMGFWLDGQKKFFRYIPQ